MGRVYLVASGKGGTGKTSVTAGVGAALAARGKRVLLIDCDIGMRNLDLVLGLSAETSLDLYDVALRGRALAVAVVSHPELPALSLLNCPALWPDRHPDEEQLRQLRRTLLNRYDVVLADAPAGLGTGFQLAEALSDEALLVTTPDTSACRDASLTARTLRQQGLPCRLIINRVQPSARKKAAMTNAWASVGNPGWGAVSICPTARKGCSARMHRAVFFCSILHPACSSV